MATTALNIVMRIGGPTLTTVCATFLGWQLGAAQSPAAIANGFAATFAVLCVLHIALVAATLRLPARADPNPPNSGQDRE